MDLNNLKFFQMAEAKLDWLAQRQQNIAANVANANTPNYQPTDVEPFSFKQHLSSSTAQTSVRTTHRNHINSATNAAMAVTNANHVTAAVGNGTGFANVKTPSAYETSPDGNGVVLEEQMAKMGEVRHDYDMTLSLYQKNLKMIRTAIGKR